MEKKLTVLVVTLIMMIGVFALTGCNLEGEPLAEYKESKLAELQDYSDAKSLEGNYSEDSLASICGAVTAGEVAIEAATTKSAVIEAFNAAKVKIDEVEEAEMGSKIEFTEVKLGGKFKNIHETGSFSAVIRSWDELIAFLANHEIIWETKPLWERYEAAFFESKALLLYLEKTATIGTNYLVENISFRNDKLTFYILAQNRHIFHQLQKRNSGQRKETLLKS